MARLIRRDWKRLRLRLLCVPPSWSAVISSQKCLRWSLINETGRSHCKSSTDCVRDPTFHTNWALWHYRVQFLSQTLSSQTYERNLRKSHSVFECIKCPNVFRMQSISVHAIHLGCLTQSNPTSIIHPGPQTKARLWINIWHFTSRSNQKDFYVYDTHFQCRDNEQARIPRIK